MRTLVLAAGVLLLVALAAFLAIGKWKNPFNRRDLPQRLGLDIQQEANGWTYTHGLRGHTLYKIHASKLVQLKQGNHVLLHDVKIEIYGEDGSRVDRIEGNEFEYDPTGGVAKASGPVEITLMRPGEAPAIAPKATAAQALGDKPKGGALAAVAQTAESGEIHVKTSGLVFDRNSGVATTSQEVEFSVAQGSGSALGATYDSQQGRLVLDRNVELNARRGVDPVKLEAQHAEFERGDQVCVLRSATAGYRGGEAKAAEARILFREDGSAVRLDASNGFTLTTVTGSRLAAPTGSLDFDEHNQPKRGHLEGGVTMNSDAHGRQVHGSAPTALLDFTANGELRHAHLERGVQIDSKEQSESAAGPLRTSRTWRSPVADMEFRKADHGQMKLATIRGTGGVVVTGESQRGQEAEAPSRMAADEVTGLFGADSTLTGITGTGHASISQTATSGEQRTTSGDRLEAQFATGQTAGSKERATSGTDGAAQIQSATVDGHVVLVEEPAQNRAAKPGTPKASSLRATAGRAIYEGDGEWLRLTLSPRVVDGGLQLTADKIDVSQASGDAYAHGNVKASWVEGGADNSGAQDRHPSAAPGHGAVALGGQGPAHAIAAEAELQRMTGEVTFQGQARLWQQGDSIAAPVIVLDRMRQTLMARSVNPAEPVRVVLVSASAATPGKDAAGKASAPSVIRMRGSDLKYSDAERKAVMRAGAAGNVVAETGTATTVSSEVELILLPPGNHAGKDGAAAQVDRMTARGHVTVTSEGRRGTGEQLVYSSETEEYVLTGTAAAPPRMKDPVRGTVTGEALIFNSRDDSVSIEGGGRKTTTETTAPR
jgi:lipopolysaccharide export system protein LptA